MAPDYMALYLTLQFIIVCILLLVNVYILRKENKWFLNYRTAKREMELKVLQAELEGKEDSSRQIASELHDNVMQLLGLCQLNLEAAYYGASARNELIVTSRMLVTDAISQLRNLSRNLDVSCVEQAGLLRVVENTVTQLRRLNLFEVDFQVYGAPAPLKPIEELHIYRIFQEAVHNVVRHARASLLTIRLNYTAAHFECCIRDDGAGFDDHADLAVGKAGLYNMKKRAGVIGADIEISSIRSHGTLIRIYLPPSKPLLNGTRKTTDQNCHSG